MAASRKRADEVVPATTAAVQETQFTTSSGDATTPLPPTTLPTAEYGAIPPPSSSSHNGAPATAPAARSPRVLAPDLLRGLLMVLQAVDHCALSVGAWQHGVAVEQEQDGVSVSQWNYTVAWAARMLTHLCAPGFVFLMGMGVVYFADSRRRLGWTAGRMARHFVLRAAVLVVLNQVIFTWPLGMGRFWIFNIVLLALAVDYAVAGLLWVGVITAERFLAERTKRAGVVEREAEEEQPLLEGEGGLRRKPDTARPVGDLSWHALNCGLLVLMVVTLWSTIWLSPDHGHCVASKSGFGEQLPKTTWKDAWEMWFLPVFTEKIISGFPPLPWFPYAVLGMLYARILTARKWPARTVNSLNVTIGVVLLLLFVMTRLLNFGNLSEGCLHMPEHAAHPERNQYLASFRSFLYIIKYPPDVAYFALTMSVNFLLLALFGALPPKLAARLPGLLVFGTSALFFYLVHILLYTALGAAVKALFGHELDHDNPLTGGRAVGVGNSPLMWLTWLLGLAIMYPLCLWYGRFKRSKGPNSIWRFF